MNEQQYWKQVIRINTTHSMSQQKFNLFREESEGYSKLIAELCTPFDENGVNAVIEHMQSLIGNQIFDILFNLV